MIRPTTMMARASWRLDFGRCRHAELKSNYEAILQLDDLLRRGLVTLRCTAHDAAHKHAFILATQLRDHLENGYEDHPV
ncbi:MAG TPA: hypothetical protein VFG62_19640 [Rhodopila sp.]|jgi:uncharacterized protein YeaO (DUF488 family)|nr:hypothetical protein [Rhodopila sp.]